MSLFPYQIDDAAFLAARQAALLWGDPGCGKTATAIAAALDADVVSALVLCPLSTVLHWQREWSVWGSRTAVVVRGPGDIERDRILIMNPDKLHNPAIRQRLKGLHFDALILDESQAYKSPVAKRTRYVLGPGGLCHQANRVWLLSGTPCPQGPIDLHTPIKVLFPSVLNGLSRDEFIMHYHVLSSDGLRIVGTRRMGELQHRLSPFVRRRRIEDCDLPPLRFMTMPLPRAGLALDDVAMHHLLNIAGAADWQHYSEQGLLELVREESVHLSTLRKLLAAAKAATIARAALEELQDGRPKLVIFCWHLAALNTLHAIISMHARTHLLTGATPLPVRQQMIDAFQGDPDTRVLLLQGDAGGLGITLHAANECWFVDCPWTPSQLLQAAKRLHRIGQRKPVLARIFTVSGTIDEAVARVIARKAEMITDLQPDAAEGEILCESV